MRIMVGIKDASNQMENINKLEDKKQFTKIISNNNKFTINVLGDVAWCTILTLATIIIMITQIVRRVNVKDIQSHDISGSKSKDISMISIFNIYLLLRSLVYQCQRTGILEL